MRHEWSGGRAAWVGGLVGLLVLTLPMLAAAAPVSVTRCDNFGSSTSSSFSIDNNITLPSSDAQGTCLTFPRNAVVWLNGHVIQGRGQENLDSVGIDVTDGDAFVWGPGIVKAFGTCIDAGDHVAVEGLLLNQCARGILGGDSYKIKEVRIHDCTPSGDGIGIDLEFSEGGFIESSIVSACDDGVWTGKNNKIWNLVVTNHLNTGLQVGGGTAVSRTVISTPASFSTFGLDYRRCDQFEATDHFQEGCQDGSNSIQDHTPGFNILTNNGNDHVVTDGHTNCAGDVVPFNPATGLINDDC